MKNNGLADSLNIHLKHSNEEAKTKLHFPQWITFNIHTCYLTKLLSHIQHSLPEEVLHHHLIEDPLAVSLPAPIYPHAADVRVKILKHTN